MEKTYSTGSFSLFWPLKNLFFFKHFRWDIIFFLILYYSPIFQNSKSKISHHFIKRIKKYGGLKGGGCLIFFSVRNTKYWPLKPCKIVEQCFLLDFPIKHAEGQFLKAKTHTQWQIWYKNTENGALNQLSENQNIEMEFTILT